MKNRIALLMVVSIISIMALAACGLLKDMTAVNNVGKTFMTTLRDVEPDSSWAMMTPELQDELVSQIDWAVLVSLYPFSKWSFSNTQIENNSAIMKGEAILGERTFDVNLVFVKKDDTWWVAGFNVSPQ